MRAFIFSVWVHCGKTTAKTIESLESLAAKQFSTAEQGGRYVVSASVQGKSFTYELPDGQTGFDFLGMAHDAWRMLKIGGSAGAQMTDAELETYLCDPDGEVTNCTVAAFTQITR